MVQEQQIRCTAKGRRLSPTQTWWVGEGRSCPPATGYDWSNYAGNIMTMSSLLGYHATVLLLSGSAGEGE